LKSIRTLLLCMLSTLLPCDASAADSLQQVLDKVASVYGPAPGAIRETGTTYSALEGEGSLQRLYKFPDKFHTLIAYAVASEDRTMIGTKAWNKRAPANAMSQMGYILRTRSIYVMGGTAVEFATLYADFRKEGGRVHAAREEQFAAGAKAGYSFIEKVEYLESIPDSAFAPWALADSGQTAID
jgi:hypothetical protein